MTTHNSKYSLKKRGWRIVRTFASKMLADDTAPALGGKVFALANGDYVVCVPREESE